jgi:hypothetical protein
MRFKLLTIFFCDKYNFVFSQKAGLKSVNGLNMLIRKKKMI